MDKIFNKKSIIIFVALFGLIAPNQSFAKDSNSNSVCRNIFNIETNARKEHSKIRGEVNSARQKRSNDIKSEWQNRNTAFQAERNKSDQMYNGFITSIKAKAKTEAEILAVNNFEIEIKASIKESREKVDAIWQDYKNTTILSLSKQDSLSETYFKEVEMESLNRLNKLRDFCKMNNVVEIKKEVNAIKQLKDRGIVRSAFLRKSKLEINQAATLRDKKILEVRDELTQKIIEIYNALPESLRK